MSMVDQREGVVPVTPAVIVGSGTPSLVTGLCARAQRRPNRKVEVAEKKRTLHFRERDERLPFFRVAHRPLKESAPSSHRPFPRVPPPSATSALRLIMSAARLREALTAGGPTSGKGDRAAAADGVLSPTPDTPDAAEWRARASIIDTACASSSYLDEESGAWRVKAGTAARRQRGGGAAAARELVVAAICSRLFLSLSPPSLQPPSRTSCTANSPGALRASPRSPSVSSGPRSLRSAASSGAFWGGLPFFFLLARASEAGGEGGRGPRRHEGRAAN